MQHIISPSADKGIHPLSVFLTGGISNCADWQSKIAGRLMRFDINLFNPRRAVYPKGSFEIEKQISWEYWWLRHCDILAFWFAPETLNPITLFELGSALCRMESQILVVGVSPEYERRFDVIVQCRLRGQEVLTGFDRFLEELKIKIDCLL